MIKGGKGPVNNHLPYSNFDPVSIFVHGAHAWASSVWFSLAKLLGMLDMTPWSLIIYHPVQYSMLMVGAAGALRTSL